MHIGAFALANNLFVAPMAGVTDRPFRQLCRRLGAGHAVSEMISARPELRDSRLVDRDRVRLRDPGVEADVLP